jgi:cytochrome c oxidase cbb3-type subunit I/II
LFEDTLDWAQIQKRVGTMAMLGVPYDAAALSGGGALAQKQAQDIVAGLVAEGGPQIDADREVIALIAYMQRLGTDIKAKPPASPEKAAEAPAAAPGGAQGGN